MYPSASFGFSSTAFLCSAMSCLSVHAGATMRSAFASAFAVRLVAQLLAEGLRLLQVRPLQVRFRRDRPAALRGLAVLRLEAKIAW